MRLTFSRLFQTKMPTKVLYKGRDGEVFFIYARSGMLDEWRQQHAVPLFDVLAGEFHQKGIIQANIYSFVAEDIYVAENEDDKGRVIHPHDNAILKTFETTDRNKICKKILAEGHEKVIQ